MLITYLDDSGTHDSAHNCVIAGYFGHSQDWTKFNADWNAVLASEGATEFHGRHFFHAHHGHRRNPFSAWDAAKRDRFLDQLLLTIMSNAIFPIACGVVSQDWLNQSDEARAGLSANPSPERWHSRFMVLQYVVFRAASYGAPDLSMDFVCDSTSEPGINTATETAFNNIKLGTSDLVKIGNISFEDSGVTPGLQAADLLAHQAHRYGREANGDKNYPGDSVYHRAVYNIQSREDFLLFDAVRFGQIEALRQQFNAAKAQNFETGN